MAILYLNFDLILQLFRKTIFNDMKKVYPKQSRILKYIILNFFKENFSQQLKSK